MWVFTFALLPLLYACQHWQQQPYRYPKKGMTLILHEPVTVQADTTGVYIQDGKITGGAHSRRNPYCEFRVRKLKESPQTIQPDRFLIKRAGTNTRLVSYSPVQLATLYIQASSSGGDAPSDVIYTIEMKLYSAHQPDVILLECGGAEDHPAEAYAPTLEEIQVALGNIATLEPWSSPGKMDSIESCNHPLINCSSSDLI
ncbi:MAG TPA: hypothetical protein EYP51_01795 [Thiotrichales bacterium]|nr:hypothetical protein [Thiotrichales bacterium]